MLLGLVLLGLCYGVSPIGGNSMRICLLVSITNAWLWPRQGHSCKRGFDYKDLVG